MTLSPNSIVLTKQSKLLFLETIINSWKYFWKLFSAISFLYLKVIFESLLFCAKMLKSLTFVRSQFNWIWSLIIVKASSNLRTIFWTKQIFFSFINSKTLLFLLKLRIEQVFWSFYPFRNNKAMNIISTKTTPYSKISIQVVT